MKRKIVYKTKEWVEKQSHLAMDKNGLVYSKILFEIFGNKNNYLYKGNTVKVKL